MEYVIRRVLATVPVMLVVSVIVFLLIHLAPGDPVLLIVGDFATPEQIAQTRAALGWTSRCGTSSWSGSAT